MEKSVRARRFAHLGQAGVAARFPGILQHTAGRLHETDEQKQTHTHTLTTTTTTIPTRDC